MNYVPSDQGVPTPPRSTQSTEIERLQAEVKHWKDHAEEAGQGFSQVCKDSARAAARHRELVRQIQALVESPESAQYRDEVLSSRRQPALRRQPLRATARRDPRGGP